MSNDICTRRLTRELKSITKNPLTNPIVHTTPLESNIREWHYVIEGHDSSPYQGGYYWGKLIFPKEYPLKPPSVIMLTPNGRFKTGRRLCLSMSDFHPESWNPMWSVSTIITGLLSFMIESSPTLGSIETSTIQKKKLAKESLHYNVQDELFQRLFPDLVKVYQKQIEKEKEEEERRKKDRDCCNNNSSSSSSSNTSNNAGSNHKNNSGEVKSMMGNELEQRLDDLNNVWALCAGVVAVFSIICAMRFL